MILLSVEKKCMYKFLLNYIICNIVFLHLSSKLYIYIDLY